MTISWDIEQILSTFIIFLLALLLVVPIFIMIIDAVDRNTIILEGQVIALVYKPDSTNTEIRNYIDSEGRPQIEVKTTGSREQFIVGIHRAGTTTVDEIKVNQMVWESLELGQWVTYVEKRGHFGIFVDYELVN